MQKRKVYMYNKKGAFLKEFDSITDGQRYVRAKNEANIRIAANKQRMTSGYYWSYEKYDNLFEEDPEIILENNKAKKQVQKFKDLTRINEKSYRERNRVDNALEALNQSLIYELQNYSAQIQTVCHSIVDIDNTLVIQLSDPHFNELVDIPDNKYDFIIASKRLHKYANEVKIEAQVRKSKKIVIAMTGDLLNSDRRLDELLNQSTNRAKASLIAAQLLAYFITDLNSFCNVDIAYVTGNESRIKDDWGYTDLVISDNYDVLIFNMLKMMFRGKDGVGFIEGDAWELVLNINGNNLLLSHGMAIKGDTQKSIQQVLGKYAAKGIIIDYVIIGHIHFANITDIYTRSGSLVGCNTYSDRALNLITKASQVLHIFTATGDIHNKRVDLQNTEGFVGYPIEDDIEAYNAKSATMCHKPETIIKIVV